VNTLATENYTLSPVFEYRSISTSDYYTYYLLCLGAGVLIFWKIAYFISLFWGARIFLQYRIRHRISCVWRGHISTAWNYTEYLGFGAKNISTVWNYT
jgi:hypothetical protein